MKPILFALLLIALSQMAAPSVPTAEISGGAVRATLYLPSAEKGYYRGTRFDWSGVVASLTWKGHEYFGQWFEKYDPAIHDAITGPVEEFLTGDSGLGYEEAKVGEPFVRIGVGAVRKPEEKAYRRFATYDIVDPGTWTVNRSGSSIEMIHELKDTNGYAYAYRKTLRVSGDTLVIDHRLKNTGRKPIPTTVYNHNFFTLDKQTTGPDIVVRFPFDPIAKRPLQGLAEVRGRDAAYLREFEPGQSLFTEVEGFGPDAKSYDFRLENRKTGAGVRITGDKPIAKLYFWSATKTVCPEPYIDVSVDPGKESSWKIVYEFYEVQKGKGSMGQGQNR
jgi:hypothetical protein